MLLRWQNIMSFSGMQTHGEYDGVFISGSDDFSGHLRIAGPNSIVNIVGKPIGKI
jgi:hypothetical protein